MSVSAGINRAVLLGCLMAVVVVAGLFAIVEQRSSPHAEEPRTTVVRAPTKPVDVIASSTPARSSVEVSRRFYASAPVVVLADRHDRRAQRIAITSATALGVPVLIDDSAAPAEIERLSAQTVLTLGTVREVPGDRAVPIDAQRAADEVSGLHFTSGVPEGHRTDAIVMTRSKHANAAAVANARTAGATILQVPSADPRRHRGVAAKLAARPDTPVIAIGTPFARGLAYSLTVVRKGIEQPTGGYLALRGRHYVAMYGHPGARQLGVLGEQGVRASIARVQRLQHTYERAGRTTFVPTFEIIATVASGGAGKDRNYSNEVSIKHLTPMIDAAERAGVYVILDLQPGRTDFLTQAKQYRPLLERPHVGLALDPEWRLERKQKHLQQIGSVDVDEVNRVGDWLARLTRRRSLPQKLFVVHQVSTSMVKGRERLDTRHPELATVIHVDGSGPQGAKQGTWRHLRENAPEGVGWGWKNFIDEDDPMLSARQTWRLVSPHPDLITYQ